MSEVFDVLVIGGGPAGVTAALRARELGAKVALVERGELGGTGTNEGCVPVRVLARAARLMREAEHFDEYGLVGEQPAVDLASLLSRVQQTICRMQEKKQLLAHLREAGVVVYAGVGQAQFADETSIVLPDETRIQADKFILCAGGRPRHLPLPGIEYALNHTDIWSLTELPRSVAVVGASATGCQLASIFDAFGTKVWLLERGGRILDKEDVLTSEVMTKAFRQRGIEIIDGIDGVDRIEKTEEALRLFYVRGGEARLLEVEAVLVAAGWPGNADSMNLGVAGVASERGYVIVDDYLQTSAPHIFAAGDINGRMMLVQSASYEARIAAENAVLGVGQPNQHQIVPHGGFTDPEYASVGLTEEQARAVDGNCLVATVPYADLDRAIIDERTEGFCKLIVSPETHRILGAHIVGEQALEAIQLIGAGMAADMWVEQLAELELAYPTYTAIVGLAARRLVHDLGVMPLAPQWRALGKGHAAEWERSEAEDQAPCLEAISLEERLPAGTGERAV
jgi:pyruvate/2-oxoglutarate dehydrogenase complex dihydrolipoamide dehydrogenase (E3) component